MTEIQLKKNTLITQQGSVSNQADGYANFTSLPYADKQSENLGVPKHAII